MSQEWLRLAPVPGSLKGEEKYTVFLSYRSVNRPWVINLYDVLVGIGHKVFLDQTALAAGSKLRSSISDALEKSQAGVLVWSTEAADSEWVRDEYELMETIAGERQFNFVPIRLSNMPLPGFAKNRVYLDFAEYPDGPNGGELLRLLHAVVGMPLSEEATKFAVAQDLAARQAGNSVAAALDAGNVPELRRLAEAGGIPWETSAALGARTAESLVRLRAYNDALRVLDDVEKRFPRAIRPKQLRALALAKRSGESDLEKAQLILGELYADRHRDAETLGIYARTFMDRYAATKNRLFLAKSRDLYAEAFSGAKDDYYVGLNAATKSVLLGTPKDLELAKKLADDVVAIVGTEPVPSDYWRSATVAEVQLIKQDYPRAGELYAKAVASAPARLGDHDSTWMQARRLMDAMGTSDADRALIAPAFSHLAAGA